jgi:PAS domain S-box-containing protein
VFWVFLSIVLIEAIILVPSVMRRERELLDYLRSLSAAQAEGVLSTKPDLNVANDAGVLKYLELLLANPVILGGALYRQDGVLVGTFGEAPTLSLRSALTPRRWHHSDRYERQTQRYDALWEMSPLEGRYHLIIRHDATWVGREFYYFIGRISGLVLIISAFVTVATLIVLDRLVIAAILALRRDLQQAGQTLRHNQDARSLIFESVPQNHRRQDELGEVILTFEAMVNEVGEAIAEREQAEADLRLSEEKFSKAFYASPNPMSLSTLNSGQLLEVNDAFVSLYRTDRDRIISKTVDDLSLWVDRRDRERMLAVLNTQGYVRNLEAQFRTSVGQIRTVLVSAETIQLNGNTCILSVANDITDRKMAEEALVASERRFRSLIDQATDALFVVDTDGRFMDVNQEACQTLGYSRQELLQLSVPDVQKAVSLADLALDWDRAIRHPVTREGIHQRKDGSQFPVEVRLGRIEIGGKSVLLALARDISARQEMQQAQARLAEIGELAAMIVHEVRNPLTTILLGLQSFGNLDLPDRARMRLTFALEESERLQRLLNEILMYAREQVLELERLELGEFLSTLCQEFSQHPIAGERKILCVGLDDSAPVHGDRDRLKQVFINLLSNACEAIAGGDTITCTLSEAENAIQIAIHNGGDPIPPEVLPKLTQPFFTTKSSGNGLGLAITRRIVEAHKGSLSITSSADTGTTVIVQLPTIPKR